MIDQTTLLKASELKKTMDAAYTVFKKRPTPEAAATWTAATKEYTNYCTSIITDLVQEEDEDKKAEILFHFNEYKTCNTCGLELLHKVTDDTYIEHNEFLKYFPGWCYSCLLDYCTSNECEGCTVTKYPDNCPFDKIKKLHMK